MTIQIIDCEQRSETWWQSRLGLPTASEFGTVLAKGRNGEESKTRRTYLLKLAGEIITGEPMENYTNSHLERGQEMESEARGLYSFMNDAPITQVGFIRNGQKGCSPDGLIGDGGGLEIKTALPHILIPLLLKNEFPPEHVAQCQGFLWVAEREWIDLCVFWPKMPLFVMRAYRNEIYIKALSDAVDAFNDELALTVEKIRHYGIRAAA